MQLSQITTTLYYTLLMVMVLPSMVKAQPAIQTFSPTTGPAGTIVTIAGSNFSTAPGGNKVYFGAVEGAITSASSTTIQVTAPAGATFQNLSVTSNGLIGFATTPFMLTFSPVGNGFLQTSFEPAQYLSAYQSLAHTIGDFDGDGKTDVAVGTSLQYFITVHRNNSVLDTVAFTTGENFSANSTNYLCSGDFDGDGKLDIAGISTSLSSGSVFVLRNTSTPGSLSFSSASAGSAGNINYSLAAADIDGDGKLDLLMNNLQSNSFSVLRNTSTPGNISFGTRVSFTVSAPNFVSTGDIDGDGKADVMVSGSGSSISIFRNTSTPGAVSFASAVAFTTRTSGTWGTATGDLDGDGKADIAVNYSSGGSASVFRNTSTPGNISMAARHDIAGVVGGYAITIGDLDGDAKPDIAAGSVYAIKNNSTPGNLLFAMREYYNAPSAGSYNWQTICIGDMDGDGRPELTVTGKNDDKWAVLKNRIGKPGITSFVPANAAPGETLTINGSFLDNTTAVSIAGVPVNFTIVSATQVTAVVPTRLSGAVSITNTLGVGQKNGFNNGPKISSFTPISGPVGTTVTISGSNFSNTPADNIVYFGAVRATVVSSTTTTLMVKVPAGATNRPITATTFGFTTYASRSFTITFPGAGPAFTAQSFLPKVDFTTGNDPRNILAGDIDNDGRTDIVTINRNASNISILLNRSTNAVLAFAPRQNFSIPANTLNGLLADMDNDGRLDVIVSTASVIYVYRNTSVGTTFSFAPPITMANNSFYGAMAVGDLDGDGRTDIVVTNDIDRIVYFKNKTTAPGNISFSAGIKLPYVVPAVDNYAIGVTVGDFNVDGLTDVVYSHEGNAIAFLRNTLTEGVLNFARIENTNSASNIGGLFLMDMNADAKPDLVTYKGDSYGIYRNIGTVNSTSFTSPVFYQVGGTTARSAIEDMDGDGSPDLVGGNNTAATITIAKNNSVAGAAFNTSSLATAVTYTTAGNPAAVVAADFNGDGLPDIATSNTQSNLVSLLINNSAPCILNYWTGAVNTLWENPPNWSCNVVPGATSNVIIGNGATVAINSNVTVNTLSVNQGSIVTVASGYLLTVLE